MSPLKNHETDQITATTARTAPEAAGSVLSLCCSHELSLIPTEIEYFILARRRNSKNIISIPLYDCCCPIVLQEDEGSGDGFGFDRNAKAKLEEEMASAERAVAKYDKMFG